MKRLPLLAAGVTALAIAGCGSSSSSSGASSSSNSSTTSAAASAPASSWSPIQETMKNLAFAPKAIQAKVGQTIEWTNDDTVAHNVSYVSGPKFTSSTNLNQGGTFSLKLTQAGTIHYVCTIHPFMTATIVVAK